MSDSSVGISFVKVIGLVLHRLYPQKRGEVVCAIVSFILFLLTIAFGLTIPIAFKHLINTLPNAGWGTAILMTIAGYSLVYVITHVTWIAQEMVLNPVVCRAAKDLQAEVFSHLHQLPLQFHISHRPGELSTRLSRIHFSVNHFVMILLFYFTELFCEVVGGFSILGINYGWKYAGLLFVSAVLFVGVTLEANRYFLRVQELSNNADNRVGGQTLDSLMNYPIVHAFNNLPAEKERIQALLEERRHWAVRKENATLGMRLAHCIVIGFAVACATALSVWDYYRYGLTLGDVVLVNTYILQLGNPFMWLGVVIGEFMDLGNNLRQVHHLFLLKPTIGDKPGATPLAVSQARVVFDHVNFHYHSRREILNSVSFTAEPGQRVAIVGPTGAGKSTITNLLLRFFEPQSGRILIDGQAIDHVTLTSLRNAIGVIPQDVTLFNESIWHNIHYGNLAASEEDVYAAAEAAGIHDFVRHLPQGYQTIVGDRGLQLSGGEKQRIAIARCLLKKPKILICDEATSALDMETERAIQNQLSALTQELTTITIAHRLSTIIDADQIFVLEKGCITARGTHKSLMEQKGLYAQLWQQQKNKGYQDYSESDAPSAA